MAADSTMWARSAGRSDRAKHLSLVEEREEPRDLAREILEEFEEASGYGSCEPWREAIAYDYGGHVGQSPLAWRLRQIERGLCRYCTRPALLRRDGTQLSYCHVHRAVQFASARLAYRRIREDKILHEALLARRREKWHEQYARIRENPDLYAAFLARRREREGWRQSRELPLANQLAFAFLEETGS